MRIATLISSSSTSSNTTTTGAVAEGRLMRRPPTGERVDEVRLELGGTFLHGLEHGTKKPCLNRLDILAKSFELTISELMSGV
jgi:hypothetical protein